MTRVTYYMYPCDTCHMNSERIRDKWLILSHMSKGSLKLTKRTKREYMKREKNIFSSIWPGIRQ